MASGEDGGVRSELSGSASDVVQARDVVGGIHFHGSGRDRVPVPAQLPADIRGFVNRTADLNHLDAVLSEDIARAGSIAVCVIAGTAGVGKTSLAVRWAHRHRSRFPNGQLYVNLRGYDPGEPIAPGEALVRFLTALGLAPGAVPTDLDDRAALFRSLLADQRILIVLDNAATVGQVRPLLPGAGRCLALVTSRSRLSGLFTRDGAHRVTLGVFDELAAVELLRTTTAGYRTDDDDAEFTELAELCARLPLALRIAAERAAARPRMPMADLIEDLRDESNLWDALSTEDGETDAVRTVFAWSYRALPIAAARLFRLLGLHPGSDFSAPAAAALVGVSVSETRRLLDGLVGAHLIEQTARDRYQFHDLLRAYALDLTTHEESIEQRKEALVRTSAWYLSAASAAASTMGESEAKGWGIENWGITLPERGNTVLPAFTSHDQALAWVFAEADNAFAASRAAAAARLDEIAWKLPAVLHELYVDRHPVGSWIPIGQSALEAARRASDRLGQVAILIRLGISYRLSQQLQESIDAHLEALSLAREIGGGLQSTAAVTILAIAQVRARRLDDALDSYEQALSAALENGSSFWAGWARGGVAIVLFEQGNLAAAMTALGETLRDADLSAYARAECLWIEAMILRETGQTAGARTRIAAALKIAHELSNAVPEALYETERGKILLATGEPHKALSVLQRAALMQRRLGDRSREADALDAAGEACQALMRFDEAAELHRSAIALHRDLADRWHLALAQANLARALIHVDATDEAVQYLEEALACIIEYDDPRARALRSHLTSMIDQVH